MKHTINEILDLQGKVALVTGGAKGIGQAIAQRLAEAGAKVVITDVDVSGAQATAESIRNAGHECTAIFDDAASTDDAAAVVRFAIENYGRLDILINNAGVFEFRPILEMDEAIWDKTLSINLKGAAFLSKAAAKIMIEKGHGGRIINISSIDATHPTGNLSHYDASKAGLEMLTRSIAKELAPHNILVNAVAPGGIATPGVAHMTEGLDEFQRKAMMDNFIASVPMKRMGEPEEIADVCLFLCGKGASYMTGSVIRVDGGALLN